MSKKSEIYEMLLVSDAKRFMATVENNENENYFLERERLIETLSLGEKVRDQNNFDKAIEIGKIILPLVVTSGLFMAGLAFEETGTLRSNIFRTFLRKAI